MLPECITNCMFTHSCVTGITSPCNLPVDMVSTVPLQVGKQKEHADELHRDWVSHEMPQLRKADQRSAIQFLQDVPGEGTGVTGKG